MTVEEGMRSWMFGPKAPQGMDPHVTGLRMKGAVAGRENTQSVVEESSAPGTEVRMGHGAWAQILLPARGSYDQDSAQEESPCERFAPRHLSSFCPFRAPNPGTVWSWSSPQTRWCSLPISSCCPVPLSPQLTEAEKSRGDGHHVVHSECSRSASGWQPGPEGQRCTGCGESGAVATLLGSHPVSPQQGDAPALALALGFSMMRAQENCSPSGHTRPHLESPLTSRTLCLVCAPAQREQDIGPCSDSTLRSLTLKGTDSSFS